MNWKRAFTWVLVALLSIGLTVPAKAILGIGAIVFDPSNYAEAIQQLIQLEQQYAQLVQTYQQVRAHYETKFITPTTKSTHMSAQQQPRQ